MRCSEYVTVRTTGYNVHHMYVYTTSKNHPVFPIKSYPWTPFLISALSHKHPVSGHPVQYTLSLDTLSSTPCLRTPSPGHPVSGHPLQDTLSQDTLSSTPCLMTPCPEHPVSGYSVSGHLVQYTISQDILSSKPCLMTPCLRPPCPVHPVSGHPVSTPCLRTPCPVHPVSGHPLPWTPHLKTPCPKITLTLSQDTLRTLYAPQIDLPLWCSS